MSHLITEHQEQVCLITFNRTEKHNAFDDHVLRDLQQVLQTAIEDTQVRVIVLKAHGKHFSAGADLAWMQRMANFSEQENVDDALILAKLMHTLHHSPKPTIAMVHGAAMGGGAGLVAACDIAIAASSARFCFSEVKLGLIPAVISPYVIKAIGERAANCLFMTAETFDANRAKELHLVHQVVPDSELLAYTLNYAEQLAKLPGAAVQDAKALVRYVAEQKLDEKLLQSTATLIAKKRVSAEGQKGLQAFLNKEKNR